MDMPGPVERRGPPAIELTPVFAPSPRPSPRLFDFALLSPPGDDGETVHITFGPSSHYRQPSDPPRASSAPPSTTAATSLAIPLRPRTALARRLTDAAPLPSAPPGELLPPPPPLCMSLLLYRQPI
jgi:hypothetical protein